MTRSSSPTRMLVSVTWSAWTASVEVQVLTKALVGTASKLVSSYQRKLLVRSTLILISIDS
jgi:hypothetical protein